MWVDKDDMFTDDKVQAFKESNPNARMHLRTMQSTNMHYCSPATSRLSSTSYFAPHIPSMSSDGCSDLADIPPTGSIAEISPQPVYVPHSDPVESAAVTNAFRQLVLHSPTQSAVEPLSTVFEVSIPQSTVIGDEDSTCMASQAVAGGVSTSTGMQCHETESRDDSDNPNYKPDMQPCPRGCGPRHYCHRHTPSPPHQTSPAPIPIPPCP